MFSCFGYVRRLFGIALQPLWVTRNTFFSGLIVFIAIYYPDKLTDFIYQTNTKEEIYKGCLEEDGYAVVAVNFPTGAVANLRDKLEQLKQTYGLRRIEIINPCSV